jgi:predicted outer membrane repeat protein
MLVVALVIVLAGLLPSAQPPVVYAANFTVDSTSDDIDDNTADGLCHTAANTCTLRAAIMQANATGGANIITLTGGTYTLTITGTDEDNAALGDLDVRSTITINGAGATASFVDANHVDRVFDVIAGGSLTLSGLTVQGGTTSGAVVGGGIRSTSGTVQLTNVTVISNLSGAGGGIASVNGSLSLSGVTVSLNGSGSGGGVYIQGTNATITGSTLNGNVGSNGGGFYHAGGGVATIINTNFADNSATTFGGGIYTLGALTMTGGTVSGNSTVLGGGIALDATATGGAPPMRITGTRVQSNQASRQGGGIYVFGTPDVVLTDMTIAQNQTVHGGSFTNTSGGGIYTAVAKPIIVNRSTINNNTSYGGGGLWIDRGLAPTGTPGLIMTNSTVSTNTGIATGGGLMFAGGEAMLTNVTVMNNVAPAASGANIVSLFQASTTFRNTIIAGGVGGDCVFQSADLLSTGGNLEGGTSCQLTQPTDKQNTNPQVGPLQDNGGATKTHALQSGSPAIDGGINTGCPSEDQRQQPRPRDGNSDGQAVCDSGAFEAATGISPAPTPTPTACNPRPRVTTQATPTGDGRLQVTVGATSQGGSTNALQAITWGTFSNATVQVNGIGPVASGQRTPLPAGTTSVVFVISRATPGQASTVGFTSTDACGDFPSFAGGGPSAF